MATKTPSVSITASTGSPRKRSLITAEMAPSAMPSSTAYRGPVYGDVRGRKIATIATTSPPMKPTPSSRRRF
jgi:hypothetical protein